MFPPITINEYLSYTILTRIIEGIVLCIRIISYHKILIIDSKLYSLYTSYRVNEYQQNDVPPSIKTILFKKSSIIQIRLLILGNIPESLINNKSYINVLSKLTFEIAIYFSGKICKCLQFI